MAKHECIECIEGKHEACNGTAYIDFGDGDLAEEECRCRDHRHALTPNGQEKNDDH